MCEKVKSICSVYKYLFTSIHNNIPQQCVIGGNMFLLHEQPKHVATH